MSTVSPPPDALLDAPCRAVRFGEVGLEIERRPDGVMILNAAAPLMPYERNLLATFWRRAGQHPDRPWLARRGADGAWRRLTYAQGRADISAVAAWLARQAIAPGRSILVLSENSFAHAVWMFGAIAAGIPICSVSVNYALLATGFDRLRHIVDLVRPAVVFAEQGAPFAPAIAAVAPSDAIVVSAEPAELGHPAIDQAAVLAAPDVAGIGERIEALDPAAPARYLLTSGSTGRPKAVIHTQAMMTAHAASGFQAMGDAFAWDGAVLDWLPWSHIAGSSLLTNISYLGGTLYIDDGRPTPERFGETLRNLRELPTRYYGTMPSGYAMLADALEADAELRRVFFGDLRAMLFGGAGLPQPLHDRLQQLAVQTTGERFVFVSGYGSTETCSAISYTWWNSDRVGIGLPIPGASLKLVPADGAYELRAKGPSITPGYFGDPRRAADAFDEEGFLRMEDMADFHDRASPEQGLYFAGRRAEQFKLSNGTFVAAGRVREALLKACPGVFADLVICGEGHGYLAVLAWPDIGRLRRLANAPPSATAAELIGHAAIRAHVRDGLARYNLANPGESARARRLLFLTEPPSVTANEVSDKGSLNRSAVVRRRAGDIARLYDDPPDGDVLLAPDAKSYPHAPT